MNQPTQTTVLHLLIYSQSILSLYEDQQYAVKTPRSPFIYLFAKHTYTYKGKKKFITVVARGPKRKHEAYKLLSLLEVRGQKLLE